MTKEQAIKFKREYVKLYNNVKEGNFTKEQKQQLANSFYRAYYKLSQSFVNEKDRETQIAKGELLDIATKLLIELE